jgi:hypothetical protein
MQAFPQALFASLCFASILPDSVSLGSVAPGSDLDEVMATKGLDLYQVYRDINCTTSFSRLDYGRYLQVYTG